MNAFNKCPLSSQNSKTVTNNVLAAYFMRERERSYQHASIISLGCGLGKTLSALLLVKNAVDEMVAAAEKDPNIKLDFAATLVLCPPVSVEVWQKDIEKFFPGVFRILQFYGTEYSITDQNRLATLVSPATIDRLNEVLSELKPEDPKERLGPLLNAFKKASP